MDPQTALENLVHLEGDEYREQLADLLNWYDMGGWMPEDVTVGIENGYRCFNWRGMYFTWWGKRGYF